MKVRIESLLCNQPRWVKNSLDVNTLADLDKLIKMVVVDRTATITRADGKSTDIVHVGSVRDEVWNNKQLLVDWINLEVDEFPPGGSYKGASI